jgi:pyrroline-5-carboxylate reductase
MITALLSVCIIFVYILKYFEYDKLTFFVYPFFSSYWYEVGNMSRISKIVIIGGGAMGRALYDGWKNDCPDFDELIVIDSRPDLCIGRFDRDFRDDSRQILWILSVKPQVVKGVISEYRDRIQPKDICVSIAAGISLENLQQLLPDNIALFRAMPNLAISEGEGAIALATKETDIRLKEELITSFGKLGSCVLLEEEKFDAFTALAGSGPAYFFQFTEYLAEAGALIGLSKDIADLMAKQVMIGSASLLQGSEIQLAVLRKNVTSEGGTTAAGLLALNKEHVLQRLMQDCLQAAQQRSAQLNSDMEAF